MFSRKPKTVASVIEMFTRTITNLEEIIQLQTHRASVLTVQRVEIEAEIEAADNEADAAANISAKLTSLVSGG